MKINRYFFLINSIWEVLRFFLLFTVLVLTFRLVILINRQAIFWLILFGSGQLLLPAGLIFLFINPEKNYILINIIRLGKILGIFASVLLILFEPFSLGLRSSSLKLLTFSLTPIALLLCITFFDLIFLLILLSYKQMIMEDEDPGSLPEFKENEILKPSEEE